MIRFNRNLGVALILTLAVPAAFAQTGQTLIGNPLLSPAKIKEVRRQIAGAARPDAPADAVPAPAMPAPMAPQAMPMQMQMPGMGQATRPNGEMERLVLSRLRVMAIVGRSALLAIPATSQDTNPTQQSMAQMPVGAMSGGYPPSLQALQMPQAPPPALHMRRASSTMVRDREPAYVEGYDVLPIINGGTVRLVLAAMPNVTVYSGMVQPMQSSPSSVVAPGALEKPSSEYIQGTSPEATSMAPGSSQQQGGQLNQGVLQPIRSRLPGVNGDSYQQQY